MESVALFGANFVVIFEIGCSCCWKESSGGLIETDGGGSGCIWTGRKVLVVEVVVVVCWCE